MFIDGVTEEGETATLTDAIIHLGKSMHLEMIAEGIEHAEQAAHLRAQGCDLAQGYHFARPLTAAAMDALLEEKQNPAGAVRRAG
jgi:EAL domain-containing protein (putative c-di-GMP-specific phosphodiesterase class I)